MSILDIVDLSNNNGSKNIKDYPADGYMFKATEGRNFTDKYCDQFVQQAIKAGKVWGVYHFMDGSPWQAQADYFINAVKGYIGKGVLCLDYEMYGRQGPTIAKKWLDYVYQKTGVRPIIYMSASVTKEENWSEVVKANYGLWVADYSAPLDKLGYWPGAMMWQYTSTPYDKNYFYGDKNTWLAYAGAKNQETPKPSQPKISQGIAKPGKGLFYRAHIPNQGWLGYVGSTQTAGTTGKAIPIQAVEVLWNGIGDLITSKAHVAGIGWKPWNYNITGTTGQNRNLEAVQFWLGEYLTKQGYSIEYRTHVAKLGWQPWVKDGAVSGTTGKKLAIEAIEFRMRKNGKLEVGKFI